MFQKNYLQAIFTDVLIRRNIHKVFLDEVHEKTPRKSESDKGEKSEKEKKREKREKEKKREKGKHLKEIDFLGGSETPDMIKIQKEKHKEHKEKQSKIRERERKIYQGIFLIEFLMYQHNQI